VLHRLHLIALYWVTLDPYNNSFTRAWLEANEICELHRSKVAQYIGGTLNELESRFQSMEFTMNEIQNLRLHIDQLGAALEKAG
jgi:hypothetical protein